MKKICKKAISFVAAAALTISSFSMITASAQGIKGVPQIPSGAIDVGSQITNATSKQSVTVASDGTKRDTAYTTSNGVIWYLGEYDLSEITSIDVRAALIPKVAEGEITAVPQIRLAYMAMTGEETIDAQYINDNSGNIRNSNNIVARIEGTTLLNSDYNEGVLNNSPKGHEQLGALFTITPDKTEAGVTVNSDEYANYPGGTVSLGSSEGANVSSGLDSSKKSGKVHLFVYGTAMTCRVAIDYINIRQKEYSKLDLSAASASMWSDQAHSHDNGKTYSYTTNKIEATRTADDNVFANLYDGDILTTYKNGAKHTHIIDLGEDTPISKMVIKSDIIGAMIYGLAKSDEYTGDVAATEISSGITATVNSDNWFRANNTLNTKKIDSNYTLTYEEKTENEVTYWEYTLKAKSNEQSYRYIIVDDNNNSSAVCREIEIYSLKPQEETPVIGVDYLAEKLVGFEDGNYTINGIDVTPENGELAAADYIGTAISIVKKGSETTADSVAQSLIVASRPNAPQVSVVQPIAAGENGKITAVDTTMEYKLSTSDTWTDVSGTEIPNLAPGTYEVRVKATSTNFTGNAAEAVIEEYAVPPQDPEIVIGDDIVNGENSSAVDVTVINPTAETDNGALIAAIYSNDICVGVSLVKDGKAEFNENITAGMTIKAFMWNALSGENTMVPILNSVEKTI